MHGHDDSDSGWLEEVADDLNLLDDLQLQHQDLGHVIIKLEPGVTRCTCGVIFTGSSGGASND